jgi:hypothetical protein
MVHFDDCFTLAGFYLIFFIIYFSTISLAQFKIQYSNSTVENLGGT